MKKTLITLLCVITICLGLAGCGGSDETSDGNALVYGSGDYTAINPALYEHGEISLLLFAGLTAHDAENNVVPGLAGKDWVLMIKPIHTASLSEKV